MFFLFKVALSLAVVFLILPEKEAERVTHEMKRAAHQDKAVRAAVDRTTLATHHAIKDAQKLCGATTEECLDTAKQLVKAATDRW